MSESDQEFNLLINELSKKVTLNQPKDVLQFCTTFFLQKLQQDREDSRQDDLHPLDFTQGFCSTQEDEEDEYEEEERDTVPDVIPDLSGPCPISRGRRTSVSAESLQPSTTKQDFIKVVNPKSSLQRDNIRVAIESNFLFKNLDEEQYTDVVDAMVEKEIKAGDHVINQGAVGDYFYIVESGQLDCFIDDKKVTSYERGGSFGELALMYNAPRAASIVAVTDGKLYALDRVTFRSILMENTARKRRMYEQFLEGIPLFKSLETYERHKIADALEPVQFDDNDVVIKEGDVGDNFYLIESGEAKFYKLLPDGSQQEVMVGKKGEYFGELALLHDEPRAASVVAQGKLKCATLGKKAFNRLLGPVMDILKRNSENYHAVLLQSKPVI
ncbi:cAMP dependent protein kinase regulatory subunit [Helicostylum pulchrum]|nr:cAMP dependent protein kinase regulatory subunit [Helicostylum pulchrum]